MQKIKQLPLSEIQKIAAGQVVERPASVVKELLENAIDAGATKISLYIEEGGARLIRVVDNGVGMSEPDALLCFERHATSKITTFEQLQTVNTFGFRGEALYSIGAVSDVTLITKEAAASYGICVNFAQGAVLSTEHVSGSMGTDISVQNLFAHVPVRKKFLKKEETELRLIIQLFQAFCFSYPNFHFQLFSENKLVYNCPPGGTLITRSAQIWDAQVSHNMLLVEPHEDTVGTISGAISQHHFFRYNRNQIFFFVNKRWVKNYPLSQAMLKGYLNVLPPARYPIAIFDIQVDPCQIDVNIHPRKEEVNFLQAKQIENLITAIVKKSLEKALSEQLKNNEKKITPSQPFSEHHFFINPSTKNPFNKPYSLSEDSLLISQTVPRSPLKQEKSSEMVAQEYTIQKDQKVLPLDDVALQLEQKFVKFEEAHYEVLGVIKKTYIVLDHPEGVVWVDQHAAHERVLFERFSKRFEEISSIKLMFPEVVNLTSSEVQVFMDNMMLLNEHGINFDQMGENQIIITSIPVHLKSVVWPEFLREISALFIEHETVHKDEFFTIVNKKLQAQMACKAAVKAGDVLTDQQINQLLIDLDSTQDRYTCPHGRPTSWLLPLYEIEKKFKRKL
jgi:DNA mismatch repair protein MutL